MALPSPSQHTPFYRPWLFSRERMQKCYIFQLSAERRFQLFLRMVTTCSTLLQNISMFMRQGINFLFLSRCHGTNYFQIQPLPDVSFVCTLHSPQYRVSRIYTGFGERYLPWQCTCLSIAGPWRPSLVLAFGLNFIGKQNKFSWSVVCYGQGAYFSGIINLKELPFQVHFHAQLREGTQAQWHFPTHWNDYHV